MRLVTFNMITSQRRNDAFFASNDLQPHVFPGAAPPLWTLQDPESPSGVGGWWDITETKSFPSGPLTLQLLASIPDRLLRVLFGDQKYIGFVFLTKYQQAGSLELIHPAAEMDFSMMLSCL